SSASPSSSIRCSARRSIGAARALKWRTPAPCRRSKGTNSMPMKSLFLQAPSFDGYDGGAGARYQMKREVKSFWFPTWLAQAAAMVPGSKLIDAPPHKQGWKDIEEDCRTHDFII